jgi:copper chaperone CopZ
MKTTLLLAAFAAFITPLVATAQTPTSMAARTNMVTVKVNGLVCDFCVQSLTKTFKNEKAVDGFHVDLNAKEIHMTFKPGLSLDDGRIRKLVTDAGYNVVGIARTGARS